MPKTKATIQQPGRYDILCGKGKECNGAEGSQRYRLVIDSYRERYAGASTRHQKCALTLEIYELLAKTSSRFLKYNEKMRTWKELPFMTARDKIGHALRFANRKGAKRPEPLPGGAALPPPVAAATATANTAPSTTSVAAVSLPPVMYGSLQAMQAQQQGISCSATMQTMAILRNAGLHPAMLQQAHAQMPLQQIPQLQQSVPQGNQMDTNKFMSQVRQIAVQHPLHITNRDSMQRILSTQLPAGELGAVTPDSEPDQSLPQGDAKGALRNTTAEPNNILEQAKQHLVLAFNQSTTPSNIQQTQDSVKSLMRSAARNTATSTLDNTMTTLNGTGTIKIHTAPKIAFSPSALKQAGKAKSSAPMHSEVDDHHSIMQDSIDTMETIEENGWERLNDVLSSGVALKTNAA